MLILSRLKAKIKQKGLLRKDGLSLIDQLLNIKT